MKVPIDKFESWLINKGLKDRTVENYLYYFNKFTYEVFNQETVSRFLAQKPNRNTIARAFLLNFQKFLKVNYKEFNLDHAKDDILEVELPKISGRKKQRIPKPLTREQIFKLESVMPSEKEKLELLISYYCGLRVGGMIKLKPISFDWEEWKKDRTKLGKSRVFEKGDKEGVARIPSKIMERIANFIYASGITSADSYLFIKPTKNNQKIKNLVRTWQLKLAKAGIDSGITQIGSDGKPIKETVVYPHLLRHSFASHFLSQVKDLNKVKVALRHSDITSTQVYTHVDDEEMDKDVTDFYSD